MSHIPYRSDIDGLRAVAVLLVVIFHAAPNLFASGFIGVDIFFVISGYLITKIIFSDLDKSRFTVAQFYVKRIKRIFPSLLLVLLSCWLIGWFVLLEAEYQQLGKHILAGASFISNFVLWNESGYFDTNSELKPLLHLWSLSIEEQFYLFWPLVLSFFFKSKKRLFYAFSTIAIISFGLNIFYVAKYPTPTFYLPHSRTWELLIGAFLAYLEFFYAPKLDFFKKPKVSTLFSGIGFLLLLIGLIALQQKHDFPSYWAFFPTIGAFLIILVGERSWLNKNILGNKFLVKIGLISYPLYLWHWPLLAFIRVISPTHPGKGIRIAAVALSFVLSYLTYKFIEQPIRFKLPRTKEKTLVYGLSFFMVGFFGLGLATYLQDSWPISARSLIGKLLVSPPESDKKCIETFPFARGWYCNMALNDKQDYSVALIGDSHSHAIYFGLRDYFLNKKEGLVHFGIGGCPFLIDVVSLQNGDNDRCANVQIHLKEVANNPKIKKVIIHTRGSLYVSGKGFEADESNYEWRLVNKKHPELKSNYSVFKFSLAVTIDFLKKHNKEVSIILDTPELGFDPKDCFKMRPFQFTDIRKDCSVSAETVLNRQRDHREIINSLVKKYPGVNVFDPLSVLCEKGSCQVIKDNKPMYRDDDHLSLVGSNYLGKFFNF